MTNKFGLVSTIPLAKFIFKNLPFIIKLCFTHIIIDVQRTTVRKIKSIALMVGSKFSPEEGHV